MRNGGEQGHLSFLQKSGWGTVGEGGLVMTAYELFRSAMQGVGKKTKLLTAP